MAKRVVYIDLDDVLVLFESGVTQLSAETLKMFEGRYDEVPGIFSTMKPVPGGIEAFKLLSEKFDCYILSTSPWDNPTAASDKVAWVKKYLGEHGKKRLILSHNKHLNIGDFLIDDRTKNGADKFQGKLILFGSKDFPNWDVVVKFLLTQERKTYTKKEFEFISEILWGNIVKDQAAAETSSLFERNAEAILEKYPRLDKSFFDQDHYKVI